MEKSPRFVDTTSNRFSDIITKGFTLFYQNYGKILLPLAFFQVMVIVLDILLLTDLRWHLQNLAISVSDILEKFIDNITLTESEWNTLATFLILNVVTFFFQNLIGAIMITIAMCSVSNFLFNTYNGTETNFRDSFKSAFNKKIFLVILMIGICIPLGSLMLFVPAIILFGFFIFLVFTYNMKEVEHPISEARRISKGNIWKIFGIFIFNFAFIFIIKFIFGLILDIFLNPIPDSWLAPNTRSYGMIILYQILINLVDIILAPLFICLLTVLFASLKARKDFGFGYQTQHTIPEERTQQPQLEDNFYCPFCGYAMKVPKRFCPNCGEKFSFMDE